MRIYLSIFLIFLMGLAKVQAQTNEKESVIKNDKIVSSQTLVDALANRIPGARNRPASCSSELPVCLTPCPVSNFGRFPP